MPYERKSFPPNAPNKIPNFPNIGVDTTKLSPDENMWKLKMKPGKKPKPIIQAKYPYTYLDPSPVAAPAPAPAPVPAQQNVVPPAIQARGPAPPSAPVTTNQKKIFDVRLGKSI